MRVITYQSLSGAAIHLTADQVAELERWGVWPRDGQGEAFCTVTHGEHAGTPTYSGAELARFICNEVEFLKAIQRTIVASQAVPAELRERLGGYDLKQFARFFRDLYLSQRVPADYRGKLMEMCQRLVAGDRELATDLINVATAVERINDPSRRRLVLGEVTAEELLAEVSS